MKLIDADELRSFIKDQYFKCDMPEEWGNGVMWATSQINHYCNKADAPSIDIPHTDDWEKYSERLWQRAYERGKADRPQGEWIKDKSKNIWNMVVDCYKCSNCGKKAIDHSLILDTTGLSYCPNCGARMKGADDDSD